MKRQRIAFVQTVFGTAWARRSYRCIKREFPDSPVIQVRGMPPKNWKSVLRPALRQCPLPGVWRLRQALDQRFDWDPLRAVRQGLRLPVDYLVHVDEDCFLLDGAQLREIIETMEAQPETLLAGPSDGGTPLRVVRNPFACNLFFNVIKRAPVNQLLRENPNWMDLRFTDLPAHITSELPARGTDLRPVRCDEPYELDDYEPYYPLYWLILTTGHRIQYLPVSMTPDDRRATAIRLPHHATDMCFHMWYMREWIIASDLVVNGLPNMRRYDQARQILTAQGIG